MKKTVIILFITTFFFSECKVHEKSWDEIKNSEEFRAYAESHLKMYAPASFITADELENFQTMDRNAVTSEINRVNSDIKIVMDKHNLLIKERTFSFEAMDGEIIGVIERANLPEYLKSNWVQMRKLRSQYREEEQRTSSALFSKYPETEKYESEMAQTLNELSLITKK